MPRKFVAFLITVLIIVILSLIGVGITYILRVTNIDNSVRNFIEKRDVISYTTVTTIVSSPVGELDRIPDKIAPVDINTSMLTSDVLKLTFKYQNQVGGFGISPSRTGNKISINSADRSTDKAQFVELFTKKPEENLSQAVKRIFLNGVPESFCNYKGVTLNYSFETTGLVFGQLEAGQGVQPQQCPTPYTNSTGTRFFIYDPAVPDRFGFIYVGTEKIPGSNPNSHWFESLKFLP